MQFTRTDSWLTAPGTGKQNQEPEHDAPVRFITSCIVLV
ncbi:hypothetical protein SEEACDC5_17161, partial [Salmonella enterica subsp. enterica serovar Agona str. SA-5]